MYERMTRPGGRRVFFSYSRRFVPGLRRTQLSRCYLLVPASINNLTVQLFNPAPPMRVNIRKLCDRRPTKGGRASPRAGNRSIIVDIA
jgi:hypothetical protein